MVRIRNHEAAYQKNLCPDEIEATNQAFVEAAQAQQQSEWMRSKSDYRSNSTANSAAAILRHVGKKLMVLGHMKI